MGEQITPNWDLDALAQKLRARREEIQHVAHGEGVRLRLGQPPGPVSVEIFPGPSIARLRGPDLKVDLFHVSPPELGPETVIFRSQRDDETLWATVTALGEATLFLAPNAAVDHRFAEKHQSATIEPDTGDSSTDFDEGASASQTASGKAAEPEGHPRITVYGRVGAGPTFRTTVKGAFVGRFPLAERNEDQTTTWRNVLAFGDRALILQAGGVAKGQQVEVVGYLHTRQARTRSGPSKLVEEIYAVAIRAR